MADESTAKDIAASLTTDERRMVLAGAVDVTGTNISPFVTRGDLWRRVTFKPAELTPLGIAVRAILARESDDQ